MDMDGYGIEKRHHYQIGKRLLSLAINHGMEYHQRCHASLDPNSGNFQNVENFLNDYY
jgi:hypothetical protein